MNTINALKKTRQEYWDAQAPKPRILPEIIPASPIPFFKQKSFVLGMPALFVVILSASGGYAIYRLIEGGQGTDAPTDIPSFVGHVSPAEKAYSGTMSALSFSHLFWPKRKPGLPARGDFPIKSCFTRLNFVFVTLPAREVC
jgi:hypothetical protein